MPYTNMWIGPAKAAFVVVSRTVTKALPLFAAAQENLDSTLFRTRVPCTVAAHAVQAVCNTSSRDQLFSCGAIATGKTKRGCGGPEGAEKRR